MWKQTNKQTNTFRAATNTWAWLTLSFKASSCGNKQNTFDRAATKKKQTHESKLCDLSSWMSQLNYFSLWGNFVRFVVVGFVVWPVYLTKEASTRRGGTKVLRECWTAVLSTRRISPWRHGMAAFSWWSIWRQARTAFLGSGVPSPNEHAFSGSLRESFHAV